MNKFFAILCLFFVIYACSSGNGGDENGSNLSRPNISSGIDLRLGQLSNSASPVAVSAALQNGESITIFAENVADDFDAIYVAPSSQTMQVRLDPTGRPSVVQFQNTTLTYTNYTKENTVDITIKTPDTSRRARTLTLKNQPITQNVLDYLNGDEFLRIILQIDQDVDSETRALLAAVVGALRFVGCGVDQLKIEINDFIPKDFLPGLCDSDLPKEIEEILGFSNYETILLNLTNNKPECENPNGYDQNSACALAIWEDLVETSKLGATGDYPKNGNDTGGSTGGGSGGDTDGGSIETGSNTGNSNTNTNGIPPTNTPTPTFTPTNTPNGGSNNSFLGNWKLDTQNIADAVISPGCPFTSINNLTFTVAEETSNNQCQGNLCLVSGSFFSSPVTRSFEGFVNRNNGNIMAAPLVMPNIIPSGQLNNNGAGRLDLIFNEFSSCQVSHIPVVRDTGTSSSFIGHWSGGSSDNGASCSGATFTLELDIESNGDPTCANTPCKIKQTTSIIMQNTPTFPVTSSHLTGTITDSGLLTLGLSAPTTPPGSIFLASGNVSGSNTIMGTFVATPSVACTGQFRINKL